jgi:hypothetical protein
MWIESHQTLRTHYKVKRLCRSLGISIPTAIGHLHCLWWWCLDHAQDGCLSAFLPEDIADAVMWDGDPDTLIEGLTIAGFIDEIDGHLVVHDWSEYGEKLHRRRLKQAEKMREFRSRSKALPSRDGNVTTTLQHDMDIDIDMDSTKDTCPERNGRKAKEPAPEVLEVFEGYKAVTGNDGAVLTDKAVSAIRARLKNPKYTPAILISAVKSMMANEWWESRHAHQPVSWFFSSDDQVEKLRGIRPDKAKSNGTPPSNSYAASMPTNEEQLNSYE